MFIACSGRYGRLFQRYYTSSFRKKECFPYTRKISGLYSGESGKWTILDDRFGSAHFCFREQTFSEKMLLLKTRIRPILRLPFFEKEENQHKSSNLGQKWLCNWLELFHFKELLSVRSRVNSFFSNATRKSHKFKFPKSLSVYFNAS